MLIKRASTFGGNDLKTIYRPCTVEELLGNKVSKKLLTSMLNNNTVNHTLLFSGPAGSGKTTAARIVALGLNCESVDKSTSNPCLQCNSCKAILSDSSMDVREINVGEESGKHEVAEIMSNRAFAPFGSKVKVIIFDEAHALTPAAKELLLKPSEDSLSHVYLIFCTNKPQELQKGSKSEDNPFLDRCTHLRFNILQDSEILDMLVNVAEFEGETINQDVLDYITDYSKGVPRKALNLLDLVIKEGSWDPKTTPSLVGGLSEEDEVDVKDLCLAISKSEWSKVCTIYEKIGRSTSAETVRILSTGWFVACLKRSKNFGEARRLSDVITVLNNPIYTTGKVADHYLYNMMFKAVDIFSRKA